MKLHSGSEKPRAVQRATAATRASGVPTRTRLLDAAAELFGHRGYYGTQVNDITERARTGIGTFYRYFSDKEDILGTLLEDFFERIRAQQVAIRAGMERRAPLEQVMVVRETYRVILTALAERPDITMTLFRFGYGVSERISREIWQFVSAMTGDIVSDLTRAETAGLIVVEHKDLLAHCVTGTVLQVAHKLVVEDADADDGLEAAIETCTRFTLGGLAGFVTDATFTLMTPFLRDLRGAAPPPPAPAPKRRSTR